MNELTVVNHDGILVVDSREVATMVQKDHAKLLRDIRIYCEYLTESNFGLSDFFIENTYKDSSGRELPCYLITRKGCDMVANKMTGQKGVLFTAAYIDRFYEMERQLSLKTLPQTLPEALRLAADLAEQKEQLQIELDYSKEWFSIKRVAKLNDVDWKTFDWRKLKEESIRCGLNVKKIFDANYGEVNTYHCSVWEKVYPEYEI